MSLSATTPPRTRIANPGPAQSVTHPQLTAHPQPATRHQPHAQLTAHPQPATHAGAVRERLLARVLPGSGEESDGQELALAAHFAAVDAAAHQADAADGDPAGYCGPDCGPPGGADWWLALLPAPLIDEYHEATAGPATPEVLPAGLWDRSWGQGAGFACGGVADRLAPGPVLAGLAEDAWRDGLGELTDDELVGVLRAARRLASWSAALELSAASDLVRRRRDQEARGEAGVAEHASDEIAATLTLTGRAADLLAGLAQAMDRLPATMAALRSGDIDLPRARVIAEETSGLTGHHAAIAEQAIVPRAASQTTGQLRVAARRTVIATDPAAARTRKESAERDARVERWDEPSGTGSLAGRDLPPAHVLAADHHLTAIARELQAAGVPGTIDTLRAHVFLALLSGETPGSGLQPASPACTPGGGGDGAPASTGSGGVPAAFRGGPAVHAPAGLGPAGPGLAGMVNLTMPLATWLGLSEAPGEVAGYGPVDATDSRAVADLLSRHPRTRWCLTLTDSGDRPIAHGCARSGPGARPSGPVPRAPASGGPGAPGSASGGPSAPGPGACAGAWLGQVTMESLETGQCAHQRESPAYRPPPSLVHLIRVRQRTCSFPGCRRPAARCDLDHTIPFDRGGRTCECDLAPLCRRHHRAKQTHGWRLEQPQPGVLVWTLPSGRRYTTRPTSYPSG